MALVAIPVLVGTSTALFHHNARYEGEAAARSTMGAADAVVQVTGYPRVRVRFAQGNFLVVKPKSFGRDADGKRHALRRDVGDVRLDALLPLGSRVTPAPEYGEVGLSTGGRAQVLYLDASDPMADGLAGVDGGRAPSASDEVAVTRAMADELGMLDRRGELLGNATLRLPDNVDVRVVGTLGSVSEDVASGATILAPPSSSLHTGGGTRRFLVGLPTMSDNKLHETFRALAANGVAMTPRDLFFHPRAWGAPDAPPSPVDPTGLAIGALIVAIGLVEVVLVVGSAFAISARRQVRDLGLLTASGGAPQDVRRVVLAQGLVLGVAAAVLGAAAGIGVFVLAAPLYPRIAGHTLWTREVDWLAVAGITLVGSVTGLVAALLPAWSIGRLTPVQAISGRFPVRAGESAAHRPAFVLAGAGILLVLLGGGWIAHEYRLPQPRLFVPSPLPVVVAGLGTLLLIGGVVWAAPYVVRRIASWGRRLPLSGRFAFRDAGRHRFRTAAAAITLTVTVAGAVIAACAVESVRSYQASEGELPPHTVEIYLDGLAAHPSDAGLRSVLQTAHKVLGTTTTRVAASAHQPGHRENELVVRLARQGFTPVRVIDETSLRYLLGTSDTDSVAAFRDGKVLTTQRIRSDTHTVRLGFADPKSAAGRWSVPAVRVRQANPAGFDFGTAWLSEDTAARLGLQSTPYVALATTTRPIATNDLDRLAVYGIAASSMEPEVERMRLMTLAALGGAALLTALVAGIAVALATAEGSADVATMTAVGAGPWRRRSMGAGHGLFLGLVGSLLGFAIGIPGGLSLTQIDGLPGVNVPWLPLIAAAILVPLAAAAAGWLVVPRRQPLVRRQG